MISINGCTYSRACSSECHTRVYPNVTFQISTPFVFFSAWQQWTDIGSQNLDPCFIPSRRRESHVVKAEKLRSNIWKRWSVKWKKPKRSWSGEKKRLNGAQKRSGDDKILPLLEDLRCSPSIGVLPIDLGYESNILYKIHTGAKILNLSKQSHLENIIF